MTAASYVDAHRYQGAAIEHAERPQLSPCAVQDRDIAVVRDVWRYKFLTAPQIIELWWPGRATWAGQRRLLKLFHAGYLERFRPIARTGSFPWTYQLGEHGHQLLQHAGIIGATQRYRRRAIYDFGHVLHELQLNAWVLALRRATGAALLSWDGERDLSPPAAARRGQPRLDDHSSVVGLRDPRPRLVRPDAILKLAVGSEAAPRTLLIEYDRTRRIDKNYDKFRRYDNFLCWWWRHTAYGDNDEPPVVLFVCQDAPQRELFLSRADLELTGHHRHPDPAAETHEYTGRQHILFAVEHGAHEETLEAWQLPAFPRRHPARDGRVKPVNLGELAGSLLR